jgi:hypothetical protein
MVFWLPDTLHVAAMLIWLLDFLLYV